MVVVGKADGSEALKILSLFALRTLSLTIRNGASWLYTYTYYLCTSRCALWSFKGCLLHDVLENYQRGLPIVVVRKFHKPHLYGRELRIRLQLYYIYTYKPIAAEAWILWCNADYNKFLTNEVNNLGSKDLVSNYSWQGPRLVCKWIMAINQTERQERPINRKKENKAAHIHKIHRFYKH